MTVANSAVLTSRAGPGPGRAAVAFGGACWILAIVQYAAAQIVVAAARAMPYSLPRNYISDLGNTACGPFRVPHGTPYYVCSPEHGLMNASFVAGGVLALAGALLQRRLLPAGRLARWAIALWALASAGKAVVGLVPENTDIGLHLAGALNVPVTSAAILLISLSARNGAVPWLPPASWWR
jgi:hypothetical membrane protein